jgi:DNA ligase-associated metallophosphoesterase
MQNGHLTLAGESLTARPSGALWWPAAGLLAVGDLHLGRAERLARRGASLLPPYETAETLARLGAEIAATGARVVVCLGDSFDDDAAGRALAADAVARIAALAEGRDWIWVAGNHDPCPPALPGRAVATLALGPLDFRHVAGMEPAAGRGEVSAHYHPKARLDCGGRRISRPCFLADARRVMLPAFGTYTGGLDARDRAFDPLFGAGASALMTGRRITAVRRDRLG